MSLQVLCIGDLHLGRRPGRTPSVLKEHGLELDALGPAEAWRRVVELAIERGVDLVLLAGDVVESVEDRYEAFGHLERGVRKWIEAGIEVAGVAGNHDVEALPRLAALLPGFRLLGSGGTWEWIDVERDGGRVRVVGWSFPKRHYAGNPLGSLPDLPADDVPTIGLLHCDLDASGSQYAPVARRDLERTSAIAWFLGHIHQPTELEVERPIGYLGSLSGLDPGEWGRRGPWLAKVEHGVRELQQLSVAPLRWERVEVALDSSFALEGADLEDELASRLLREFEQLDERLEDPELRAVGVRFTLIGRTQHAQAIHRVVRSGLLADLVLPRGETVYFVEKLLDEVRPEVNLEELAQFEDPPGLLARTLITLRDGGEGADALARELEQHLGSVEQNVRLWGELDPPSESARERALRCGWQILDALLEQREASVLA